MQESEEELAGLPAPLAGSGDAEAHLAASPPLTGKENFDELFCGYCEGQRKRARASPLPAVSSSAILSL
jgi:hypothetical protein